jgi:hypothetical protein
MPYNINIKLMMIKTAEIIVELSSNELDAVLEKT